MNRERWMLLASIVLFAVAGVYNWARWTSRSPRRAPPPQAAAARTVIPQASPEPPPVTASPPVQRRASRDDDGPWGRNPFLTLAEATRSGASGVTAVRVIIVGPDRSVAMLDGQTVTVGEKFGDETVVQIRPDTVVLDRDGRRRLLRVSEPRIPITVTKGIE